MIQLKKIMYPTDFSENGAHALPYVVEFAKNFKAKVYLIHVLSVPAYAASYEIAVDLTALKESIQQAAELKMNELAAKLQSEGIETESSIELGSSFVEIVSAARRHEIDLIILATHGWGAIKHLLLGSTAERVIRKAPCPVMTVRHPEHEFIAP